MKIGCCVKNAHEAKIAQEAGFDFVECTVLSLKPEEDLTEFQKVLESYRDLSIPVEVCNLFLPFDLKIVGETLDHARIRNYILLALDRVKNIGADTIVFGSGHARNYAGDFPREKAVEQIVEFLQNVALHANPLGITIVIEPLNLEESNMINSISEGVELAEKVNRSSIQVLADFYHMDEEQEPLEEIIKYSNYLKHIHLADTGRHQPGSGSYPYSKFAQCLKSSGYKKRVSVECTWTDYNLYELKTALQFLRKQFDREQVNNN